LRGKRATSIVLGTTLLITLSFPLAFADKSISVPQGTSVPGCEDTNECWLPPKVTITPGETVTWSNDDSAAHTVTSGTATEGPDGNFDSSLFLADTTFSVTLDEEGEYPYFCMVHPWMDGEIIVKFSQPPPPNGPDYTQWIIIGAAVAAAAGGIGYFVSKSKRSSKKSVITTYDQSTSTVTSETKKGKICNVCGTNIPQGVNVCPSCGDTYS